MKNTYSLSDARTNLSAIIKRVRKGHCAVITDRGTPVAEIRCLARESTGLEARLRDFEQRGVLVPATRPGLRFEPIMHRHGALKRFLKGRD